MCQACPLGTYARSPGSIFCLPCNPGFYSDLPGQSSCEPCLTLMYADKSGMSVSSGPHVCLARVFSFFFLQNWRNKQTGLKRFCRPQACLRCPSGLFTKKSEYGSPVCLRCYEHAIADASGNCRCVPGSRRASPQRCVPCADGFYQPNFDAPACIAVGFIFPRLFFLLDGTPVRVCVCSV